MKRVFLTAAITGFLIITACRNENISVKGTLFIIGGGVRTDALMANLKYINQCLIIF